MTLTPNDPVLVVIKEAIQEWGRGREDCAFHALARAIVEFFGCDVREARKTFQRAFRADPDLRKVYVATLALCIYDFTQRKSIGTDKGRNELASEIISLIFER